MLLFLNISTYLIIGNITAYYLSNKLHELINYKVLFAHHLTYSMVNNVNMNKIPVNKLVNDYH